MIANLLWQSLKSSRQRLPNCRARAERLVRAYRDRATDGFRIRRMRRSPNRLTSTMLRNNRARAGGARGSCGDQGCILVEKVIDVCGGLRLARPRPRHRLCVTGAVVLTSCSHGDLHKSRTINVGKPFARETPG